jgi:hypothetical protein
MGLTNFRNGISSFGVPVLPSSSGVTTGAVFFVCSVNGSNGNSGSDPSSPWATIDYAVGQCTASKGDTIYAMPGHVETVTAAATLAVDVAGIRIIGIGAGRSRPTVNYTTAAAASCDITAANVLVENLVFTAVGVDAVTAAINVSAANVTIRGCEMELANATNQAVLGILTTAAADRLRIEGCHIHGTLNAGTATAIRLVGGTDIVIADCVIIGAYTTTLGGIENVTTAAVNLTIDGCIITNFTASAAVAITLVATTTGTVTNCRLSVLTGTAPIVGAALNGVGGNYYKAAAGVAAGTLL